MRLLRFLAAAGCVSLLSVSSYALSYWPEDDPAGHLDVAVAGGQVERLTGVASDGNYGVIIGWQNDTDGRAYAEHLDAVGEAKWGPSFEVSVFPAGSTQTEAGVTDDSLRGGYVAWVDDRDGSNVIYLQRIDKNGSHVGVFQNLDVVVSEDVRKLRGTLTFDGTVDVVGTDTLFLTEVSGDDWIRLESDGTWYQVVSGGPADDFTLTLTAAPPAAGPGVASVVKYDPATFDDCRMPKLLSSSQGCYVAFLNESQAISASDRDVPLLQLAYVSAEGERLWFTEVDFPHPDAEFKLCPDDEDGIIVVWHVPPYVDPDRPLKAANTSYAVRIAPDGEGVWGADPVLLFQRGGVTADTYYDRNEGVLWVAGPWWFNDEDKPTEADNGSYVVVNKLLSSGSWAWGEWTKGFEWDSMEKGRGNFSALGDLTLPMYDDFYTDQRTAGITGDGMGGAHVLIKDNRMTDTLVVGTDYHEPYQNLYAQHVSFEGKIDWMWGDERIKWNEDKSEYYITYSLLGDPRYYLYPWIEGALVYRNTSSTVKDHTRAICEPWPCYNPVPGNELASTITAVWTEDYVPAVPPLYDAIRLVQLDIFGDRLDWDDGPAVVPVLDVYDALGNLPADQFRFESVSEERYGVTIVWEENGDVYAKHCNYYQMYNAQRAESIGLGPDIFPPPPVSTFSATGGIGQVVLSWTNPSPGVKPLTDFAGVMIRRSTDGPPSTPELGEWVNEGPFEQYIDTDVESGLTYFYSVFTWDTELGERNFSGPVSAAASVGFDDVQNFLAQGTDGAVVLSWENPGGTDYAGVVIRRSEADYPAAIVDGDPVGDFTPAVTTYTDGGLTNGTIYYYTAFAYDDQPTYADGVTAYAVPLEAVTNFIAVGTNNQVNLSWDVPADPGPPTQLLDVIIRRSETGYPATVTDGELVDIFPLTTVLFQETPPAIENGVQYFYSAFAHYNIGPPVNRDVYTVPAQAEATPGDLDPPPPVSNFTVTTGEDKQVTISWDTPGGDTTIWLRVEIRRSSDIATVSNGTVVYTQPNDGTTLPTYIDDKVINGQTYYYAAIAIDDVGNESSFTALAATPIDITPPAPPGLTVRAWIETTDRKPVVEITVTEPVATDLEEVVLLRGPSAQPRSEEEEGVVRVDVPTGGGLFYDETVVVGQTYWYAAWAVDDDSNISGIVDAGPVTVVDNFPPVFLTVTATPSGPPHQAVIAWTIRELDATRYEIAYGTTQGYHLGSFEDNTLILNNTRSDTITGLWGGTTFYFKITMTDSKGASDSYAGTFATTFGPGEDTDGDGIEDQWELDNFGDLGTADATSNYVNEAPAPDGLSDLEEYHHHTDPTKADTDGDGVTDDVEVANNSDPLKAPGPPLSFREGCGAASGGAPMALALVMLGAALGALRRRREGQA